MIRDFMSFMVPFMVVFIVTFTILDSCSFFEREVPRIDIKPIADLMPMLNKLEERAQEILGTWQVLAGMGIISEEDNKEIIKHADVYVVLYRASMVFLVEGRVVEYKSAILAATSELNQIEGIVKKANVRKESWKQKGI